MEQIPMKVDSQFTRSDYLKAWAVHAFTASGVVWAGCAVLALIRHDYLQMWGWLAISLIVDGLDGTLARRYRVKEVVPWFDGSALDLIVDYLTWTFIPAIFMSQTLLFAPGTPGKGIDLVVTQLLMVSVCASSMFCYCNKKAKSSDNYFVGFPAAWNIVILYLYLVALPWWFNLIIVVLFIVLTVSPLTFCHPFRVEKLRWLNILSVVIWLACIIWLTIYFPERNPFVWWAWWISGIYFIGNGVIRTFVGSQAEGKQAQANPKDVS